MNLREKQKLDSRTKILQAATSLFKKKGFSKVGIDEVVIKAGLTAGAFYNHFKSKRRLFFQTLSQGFEECRNALITDPKTDQARTRKELLQWYVSDGHRDHADKGCPIAALGADIVRHSEARSLANAYLDQIIEDIAHQGSTRQQAIRDFTLAVGAIVLSRACRGFPLSDEILTQVRSSV